MPGYSKRAHKHYSTAVVFSLLFFKLLIMAVFAICLSYQPVRVRELDLTAVVCACLGLNARTTEKALQSTQSSHFQLLCHKFLKALLKGQKPLLAWHLSSPQFTI
ncbi:hypothetical protein CEXT_380941 [Caerostris extrusa]|uniref:Secreted protein n=1 Tax=Caerostris extrusa TaxID=172846 RepID=A0AAV4N9Y6_CAEEX|nr:hypothetical protein CEXT_380941 [Caerostris extrusa]